MLERRLPRLIPVLVAVIAGVSLGQTGKVRKPVAAGIYYPSSQGEATAVIDRCLDTEPGHHAVGTVKGVIVPDLPYAVSGTIAGQVIVQLPAEASRAIVLAPWHPKFEHLDMDRAAMRGKGSIPIKRAYRTVLGEVPIPAEVGALRSDHQVFTYVAAAHFWEHGIEVALPMLQRQMPLFSLIPILCDAGMDIEAAVDALEPLAAAPGTVVVVSGCLPLAGTSRGQAADRAVAAILEGDVVTLRGQVAPSVSFLVLMHLAERLGWRAELVARGEATASAGEGSATVGGLPVGICFSEPPAGTGIAQPADPGDEADDDAAVSDPLAAIEPVGPDIPTGGIRMVDLAGAVGTGRPVLPADGDLVAAAQAAFDDVERAAERTNFEGDLLSSAERLILIDLARRTLAAKLMDQDPPAPPAYSDTLMQKLGCFVALKRHGRLRGCIGTLAAKQPLAVAVQNNTVKAAFEDTRFPALDADEFDEITVEISVLTVPQRLAYTTADELLAKLQPEAHGVILVRGQKSATYLPQVWEKIPDKATFLANLCRKAGLPLNAWKDGSKTAVLVYEAFSFEEGEAFQ